MRSPLKVGALMPSSRWLAHCMARQLDLEKPGMVIELGAGTGAVTHALLEVVPPERLIIIERDPNLCAILSSQFPDLNIICADAAELDEVIEKHKIKRLNAIVSSLPLLGMPKAVRTAITEQMAMAVEHHGIIIQFTYGPRSPINRDAMRHHHITGKRMKTIIANIPPAHVWVYGKAVA